MFSEVGSIRNCKANADTVEAINNVKMARLTLIGEHSSDDGLHHVFIEIRVDYAPGMPCRGDPLTPIFVAQNAAAHGRTLFGVAPE
jgi:hypothetical protein